MKNQQERELYKLYHHKKGFIQGKVRINLTTKYSITQNYKQVQEKKRDWRD